MHEGCQLQVKVSLRYKYDSEMNSHFLLVLIIGIYRNPGSPDFVGGH